METPSTTEKAPVDAAANVTNTSTDEVDGVEFKIKQSITPTPEQLEADESKQENADENQEKTETNNASNGVGDNNVESSFLESDDDEDREFDTTPLNINWVDLGEKIAGEETELLAIGPLPGCRFKDTWRNIDEDIKFLKSQEFQDIFVLCTKGELFKFRVADLIEKLEENDFTVHHYPSQDGGVPDFKTLMKTLDELKQKLNEGRKSYVHCFGGIGRSVLVAASLMMLSDESTEPEKMIEKFRELRGHSAVHTVKQYNFIHDFPRLLQEYKDAPPVEGEGDASSRCESRVLSR